MPKSKQPLATQTSKQELDAFIDKMQQTPVIFSAGGEGRVLFALDATASRQLTWDHACHLQNSMFMEAGKIGGLMMKLCYFRGFQQFHQSDWLTDSHSLLNIMQQVSCAAGHTQIGKVLNLALKETRIKSVQAVIYIGDCMEEPVDNLCQKAGELGLLSTPVFIFQEGNELIAKRAFKEVARLSGGAYHSFNSASSHLLKQLLNAVAVYASGGKKALQHFAQDKDPAITRLLEQLK